MYISLPDDQEQLLEIFDVEPMIPVGDALVLPMLLLHVLRVVYAT